MKTEWEAGASVLLKNVSGGDYTVEELGGIIIADDATIDLMDEGLAAFYDNWDVAYGLVTNTNASKLWTDIQAGDIEVVSTTRPQLQGGPE